MTTALSKQPHGFVGDLILTLCFVANLTRQFATAPAPEAERGIPGSPRLLQPASRLLEAFEQRPDRR
jgi:hypothetical protein